MYAHKRRNIFLVEKGERTHFSRKIFKVIIESCTLVRFFSLLLEHHAENILDTGAIKYSWASWAFHVWGSSWRKLLVPPRPPPAKTSSTHFIVHYFLNRFRFTVPYKPFLFWFTLSFSWLYFFWFVSLEKMDLEYATYISALHICKNSSYVASERERGKKLKRSYLLYHFSNCFKFTSHKLSKQQQSDRVPYNILYWWWYTFFPGIVHTRTYVHILCTHCWTNFFSRKEWKSKRPFSFGREHDDIHRNGCITENYSECIYVFFHVSTLCRIFFFVERRSNLTWWRTMISWWCRVWENATFFSREQ